MLHPTVNIQKIFKALLSKPWLVILSITVLTLPFLYYSSGLKTDNSLDIWYNDSDSVYANYKKFKEQFGSDESLIVIYQNDSLFTREQLILNKLLSEELSELPGVKSVLSISTLKAPRIRGLRLMTVPILPTQANSFKNAKARIIKQPIFVNNVISSDGNATGIIVTLDDKSDNSISGIVEDIESIMASDRYCSNLYYLVGNIPIIEENNRISGSESVKFIVLCIVLIFILLLLHFRNLLLALAPVIVAIINVVWTMGILALCGQSLNMVVSIVPIIILVISIAVSVHIITRYQKLFAPSSNKKVVLINTLVSIVKPCLYTTITTFVAFLAFVASDIVPVASFGMYAAIGILISFFLAFTLLPSVLFYIHLKSYNQNEATLARWSAWGSSLAGFIDRNRLRVILVCIIIFIFSFIGLLQVSFESDQIKYFKETNPVRHNYEIAEQWFEGIYPIEIVFDVPEDIYLKAEKYYTYFSEMEDAISQLDEIVVLHSPIVFFNSLFPISDSSQSVGKVNTLLAGRYGKEIRKNMFLKNYLSEDGRHYLISIRTRWLNNKQTLRLISKLRENIDPRVRNTNLSYYISGLAPMYIDLNERLMENKIKSFIISFTLIFLLLLILFKNLFLALIGMIPNVAPILTTIGLMGWLNISLDIATMLIAAVSLGIAVDDTIHFLTSFRQSIKDSHQLNERIRLTYDSIGRAITLTSVLLICGFAGMIFSSYIPFIYFGIFISLNILFALLYDIFLLPAIIYLSSKWIV